MSPLSYMPQHGKLFFPDNVLNSQGPFSAAKKSMSNKQQIGPTTREIGLLICKL